MANIPCNWDVRHVPCQQIRGNSFGLPSPEPELKETVEVHNEEETQKGVYGEKNGDANLRSRVLAQPIFPCQTQSQKNRNSHKRKRRRRENQEIFRL